MSRHKARETAFQMLFQLIEGANDWQMAEHTLAEAELSAKSAEFAVQLAQGAWQKHFETEQYIRRLAIGWQYERLCSVDRLLLHLAMYELKYIENSPAPIVIDEAIELAREYGTDDSPSFVNAVLDKFQRVIVEGSAEAEYRLDEQQLRQAEERLKQAEAKQQAAAADIAAAAEKAWADKAAEDEMAAARKAAEKKFAKQGRDKLPDAPEPVRTFRKIRKADITEADRIAPEPEDVLFESPKGLARRD